jgi:microsomal prostaglandin-E synthase 1
MLTTNPQFQLYVICSAILSTLALLLGGMTAARRNKVDKYLNPEDKVVARKDTTVVDGPEHPEVARRQRAHRNLLESLPIFFALGLISVLAGAKPMGTNICLGVFTGMRVVHTIVYLNGIQPWRTISYAIGTFALIGLMVLSLLAVLA